MTLTKAERLEVLAATPWITRLKVAVPCDALRYGKMPLKAVYSMHGKPPTGTDKYKCKAPAYWRFRALTRVSSYMHPATSGNYCYTHLLFSGIHHNEKEQQRFERWFAKWEEQRASHS